MAGERNEAFTPQEDEERAARYLRAAGNGNPNPISKLMASLYDDPAATDTFLEGYLQKQQEGAARRKLMCELPGHDDGEANRPSRHYKYHEAQAQNAERPKVGTAAYFVSEMSERPS